MKDHWTVEGNPWSKENFSGGNKSLQLHAERMRVRSYVLVALTIFKLSQSTYYGV